MRATFRQILCPPVIHQIAKLLTKLPGLIGQGAQFGIDAVFAAMKCRLCHPGCAPRGYRIAPEGTVGASASSISARRRPDGSSTLLSFDARPPSRAGRFVGLNRVCELCRDALDLECAVQPLRRGDFLVEFGAETLQAPDAIGVFHWMLVRERARSMKLPPGIAQE